ncbi:MAG: glycosyltransferase [Bacteroidota bacterium]|nr:glycosyltransferase [Bacteroidota bacterium]
MQTVFNYIITIHNKEDLIADVLHAVIKCCNVNSVIYPILDGCTDRSEDIIDQIIQENSSVKIIKVHTPDVHETKSINAGLLRSDQTGHGYNIILQDDVIIDDYKIEEKIEHIYNWSKKPLGMISFRMAANFKENWLINNESAPFKNFVENIYGHGAPGHKLTLPGQFNYRAFPFKSPICIPCEIINRFGIFEEKLSPHTYDDLEYSLRLIKAGFNNGVFSIKFRSEKDWGGTRRIHQNVLEVQKRNIDFIREHYADLNNNQELYGLDMKTYNTPYYSIWNINLNNFDMIIKHRLNSMLNLPRNLFKKVMRYGN